MRWDRISVLIDRLQEDLDRQGCVSPSYPDDCILTQQTRYFYLADSKPLKTQEGIIRTNCMDNLDRTNVVQATLAKWVLTQQLRTLSIIKESESVDDYETLSKEFRESTLDAT